MATKCNEINMLIILAMFLAIFDIFCIITTYVLIKLLEIELKSSIQSLGHKIVQKLGVEKPN